MDTLPKTLTAGSLPTHSSAQIMSTLLHSPALITYDYHTQPKTIQPTPHDAWHVSLDCSGVCHILTAGSIQYRRLNPAQRVTSESASSIRSVHPLQMVQSVCAVEYPIGTFVCVSNCWIACMESGPLACTVVLGLVVQRSSLARIQLV